MKRLICITGMDGTGKSTLLKALQDKHPAAYTASIWDAFTTKAHAGLFRSRQDIDLYLCHLNTDARVLFLTHALDYAINKAMQHDTDLIFFNAYYYKYFASELCLGADPELVAALAQRFPKPDVIINLQAPVATVISHKPGFSRYECGLAEHPSAEAFTAFQERVKKHWPLFERSNWHSLQAFAPLNELLSKTEHSYENLPGHWS